MGNMKSKQRRILVNYCGEVACERMLVLLVKLYLEDRSGRMN